MLSSCRTAGKRQSPEPKRLLRPDLPAVRRARSPPLFVCNSRARSACGPRQEVLVQVAQLFEERADGGFAVVGVGPGPGLEGPCLEAQRDLGEDAVAQVDAMGLILGRGQL